MSTSTKQPVHRKMTIKEILALFPHKASRLSQEITNAGLHCMGCSAATWETLEVGMLGHGKTEQEIERLVERLNLLLTEKNQEGAANTVTLTPKAAQRYLAILEEEGKLGWGLRFAEQAAGCNGFEHVLDFSEKATANDAVFVCEIEIQEEGDMVKKRIEIHVDNRMVKKLLGSVIDYVDGMNPGFKVSNPNVRSSCGCGTSHGY